MFNWSWQRHPTFHFIIHDTNLFHSALQRRCIYLWIDNHSYLHWLTLCHNHASFFFSISFVSDFFNRMSLNWILNRLWCWALVLSLRTLCSRTSSDLPLRRKPISSAMAPFTWSRWKLINSSYDPRLSGYFFLLVVESFFSHLAVSPWLLV